MQSRRQSPAVREYSALQSDAEYWKEAPANTFSLCEEPRVCVLLISWSISREANNPLLPKYTFQHCSSIHYQYPYNHIVIIIIIISIIIINIIIIIIIIIIINFYYYYHYYNYYYHYYYYYHHPPPPHHHHHHYAEREQWIHFLSETQRVCMLTISCSIPRDITLSFLIIPFSTAAAHQNKLTLQHCMSKSILNTFSQRDTSLYAANQLINRQGN